MCVCLEGGKLEHGTPMDFKRQPQVSFLRYPLSLIWDSLSLAWTLPTYARLASPCTRRNQPVPASCLAVVGLQVHPKETTSFCKLWQSKVKSLCSECKIQRCPGPPTLTLKHLCVCVSQINCLLFKLLCHILCYNRKKDTLCRKRKWWRSTLSPQQGWTGGQNGQYTLKNPWNSEFGHIWKSPQSWLEAENKREET